MTTKTQCLQTRSLGIFGLILGLLSGSLMELSAQKSLVAYFSLLGGITQSVAREVHQQVGGDIFRIEALEEYPSSYREVVDRAKRERDQQLLPPLRTTLDSLPYDTIYLCTPIWLGQLPAPVRTFLATYYFEGKVVVPIATSGGSKIEKLIPHLKRAIPSARLMNGLWIHRNEVDNSTDRITCWLATLKPLAP